MPEIRLEHITKRWDHFYAVDDLNLIFDDNAFVTLLGPSGCGKTTILRMIAGLETPTTGKITIGGTVVFDSDRGINIPPNRRNVGFLFQNYALWPNMTVYQNISFGLTNIREVLPTIDWEARRAANLINILQEPDILLNIIAECRDRKGKLDIKRAQNQLINFYEISMQTARILLGYKLHETDQAADRVRIKLNEQQKILQSLLDKHRTAGCTLNEQFEVVKSGVIQTSRRKLSQEEIDLRVHRVLRIVKIGMFIDRYPSELSGGQQQRVAIARTLAPEPSVLFMDEPLSNLDAKLRLEMRTELQRLHIDTGSTLIYVTHDQMEAMTLATKICLLDNGVLQQYDAPLDLYQKPVNLFVADFVGSPSINFIEASGLQRNDGTIELTIFGDTPMVFTPASPLTLDEWYREMQQKEAAKQTLLAASQRSKRHVEKSNKDSIFRYHIDIVNEFKSLDWDEPLIDEEFVLGVRPEYLELTEDGRIEGEIYSAMPTGMETTVKIRIGNFLLTGVVFGGILYQIGEKIRFNFKGSDIVLFCKKISRRITLGTLKKE